jgi:hypothetical protein
MKEDNKRVNKQKVYEEEIARGLQVHKPSGRLERLIGLIRFIVEVEKEKFIIVSDRLFLLTLALHVLSPEEAELMEGMRIDETEGGDPRGREDLRHPLIGETTSSSSRWCKLG